ncbi:hypothetical protein D2T33_12345 [Sinirhodobacter populi]|uniref:Uncharacterized protein n=1 Tax=Paenirhodobacter populi TaxID=2306993 RepID=A0A443IT34_9RHOB|nr:hypothetical protein D2T33_12345 [Sinirhodobacter populi]
MPYVTFADTDMMSDSDKALFEGVERGKDGIKYRLADRMKALEQIARPLGMFKEQVEHDLSDPLRELLMQVQGVPCPSARRVMSERSGDIHPARPRIRAGGLRATDRRGLASGAARSALARLLRQALQDHHQGQRRRARPCHPVQAEPEPA